MAFESKEIAKERVMAASRKRNPVGDLTNMTWEMEAMKAEVESFPDGILVNWSDLAKRHNVQNKSNQLAKNGWQIAQEWLKSVGININRFKRRNNMSDTRIRKKKLRGAGGEITVATPQPMLL